MTTINKLAEEFTKKYVAYNEREDRVKEFVEDAEKENLTLAEKVETCDGCYKDTIAVYYAYLQGMKDLIELAEKEAYTISEDNAESWIFRQDAPQAIMIYDLKKLAGVE